MLETARTRVIAVKAYSLKINEIWLLCLGISHLYPKNLACRIFRNSRLAFPKPLRTLSGLGLTVRCQLPAVPQASVITRVLSSKIRLCTDPAIQQWVRRRLHFIGITQYDVLSGSADQYIEHPGRDLP
jgi:hypothetical protein